MRAGARVIALIGVALGALLAAGPGASAAPLQFDRFVGGPQGSGAAEFGFAGAPATDPASGQIYVPDPSNWRITRFSSDGAFEMSWGAGVVTGADVFEVCTPSSGCRVGVSSSADGGFGSQLRGIAINPDTGDLYVHDGARVQQFAFGDAGTPADPSDDTPTFVRAWGWGVEDGSEEFQVCTSACGPGIEGTGVGQLRGAIQPATSVAVSPLDGDVFVSNRSTVQRYNSDGTLDADPVIGIGAGFAPFFPRLMAADSQGILYVADPADGGEIERFDTAGAHGPVGGQLSPLSVPPLLPAFTSDSYGTSGLAVDPDDDGVGPDVDRLYVLRDPDVGSTVVQQFDEPGGVVPPASVAETHGGSVFDDARVVGLARDPVRDRLVAATGTGVSGDATPHQGGAGFYVLDADGSDPTVGFSLDPPLAGVTTAELSGAVDPRGSIARYRFEYSVNGVDWVEAGNGSVSGDGLQPVSAVVTGLEANRMYRVRLVAVKILGATASNTTISGEVTLITDAAPPTVVAGAAQHVGVSRAQIRGFVNANNLPTTYYFEYGPDGEGYGTRVPDPAGSLEGGQPRAVLAQLTGLEPGATYSYRLVAENTEGVTVGASRTFTARVAPPGPAPEARAFEMVTPPDKASRVSATTAPPASLGNAAPAVAVSHDGEAVLESLLAGVIDVGSGTEFSTARDYVRTTRTPAGWIHASAMNVRPEVNTANSLESMLGSSADLGVLAFSNSVPVFADTGSVWGTKLFDDDGGYQGAGWYDWVPNADFVAGNPKSPDLAQIDGRDAIVRWGGYAGMLGPEDPSAAQTGGRAAYLQQPVGSGPRVLVHECTTGTTVPERDAAGTAGDLADDLLGARACDPGAVTSLLGAAAGADGDILSSAGALTAGGDRLFFTSPDPAAAPAICADDTGGDTSCPPQLFVRQQAGSTAFVRWLSRPTATDLPITLLGSAIYQGASRDGRYVYFQTNTPVTDDDPNGGSATVASPASWDLYRYDLGADLSTDPSGPGDRLLRITGGDGGTDDPNTNAGTTGSYDAGSGKALRFLSGDGTRAYFVTRSALADGAADNASPSGSGDANAVDDSTPPTSLDVRHLYLFDSSEQGPARWKFVARLSTSGPDVCASAARKSGPTVDYGGGRVASNCVRGTVDGGTILFESLSQLTADDTDSAIDLYRYDAAADEIVRVSAPPVGVDPYPCGWSSGVPTVHCNADLGLHLGSGDSWDAFGGFGAQLRNVGADGAVYFESKLPLVAEDQDGGAMDVYEWRDGEPRLVSPAGASSDPWFYSGSSLDGDSVFAWTTERVSDREIEDSDGDIYVARRGGGMPPLPQPPPVCDVLAGSCQGPGDGRPVPVPIESDGVGGGDNFRPASRATLRLAVPRGRALRRAARAGKLTIRIRTSAAGRVRVVARARLAGRRKASVVARRAIRAQGANAQRVVLRLNRRARAQLRSGRPLTVAIVVRQAGAKNVRSLVRLKRPARTRGGDR